MTLQAALTRCYGKNLDTDGIYGPATRSAVVRLQRELSLERLEEGRTRDQQIEGQQSDRQVHSAQERHAAALLVVGASVRHFSLFLEQQVGSRAASEDILRDAFARSRRISLQNSEHMCSWFYRSLREAVLEWIGDDGSRRPSTSLPATLGHLSGAWAGGPSPTWC